MELSTGLEGTIADFAVKPFSSKHIYKHLEREGSGELHGHYRKTGLAAVRTCSYLALSLAASASYLGLFEHVSQRLPSSLAMSPTV